MKKFPEIEKRVELDSLQVDKNKGVATSEESFEVIGSNGEDLKKSSQIACLEQSSDVFKLNSKNLLSVIGNKLCLSMLSAFK
ncbi:hypothetical protein D1814_14640 [Alteromonas sp. BL110]|uniref:hypothetical protein n=1 Tax=Alteromonas sp. BL110 TaxID=1714845 RepID=UPI000E4F0E3D|nr:hypothetical protein [Alteromonas sp. BL110]AXT39824.1 hypothetical protein D1814_14640 [Alteromonas sp. BL110]RKM79053.1 hypothetical protein D7031_08635 [Alteromonas sp. BL110]